MAQPHVPWQVKFVAIVLVWGSSFLLMKIGLEGLDPVQIAGLRILSGAAVVVTLLLAGGGRLPSGARTWAHLTVCGFFLAALPFTLFAVSETRVSSALAGIGNAATPIATVLATLVLLPGTDLTRRRVLSVLVGFGGVVTIMEPWTATSGPDIGGFALALAGGASYGIGWTYNRRFLAGVDLGGLAMPAATLLTGLVLIVPFALVWAATTPQGLGALVAYGSGGPDDPGWLPLVSVLVLGVVGTGFAYVLQFDVVRGAGALVGTTITYLIPIVSVLLGVLVLGERLGAWQLVGFVVVLAAAWGVNHRGRSAESVALRVREQRVVPGLQPDGGPLEGALGEEPGDDRRQPEHGERDDHGPGRLGALEDAPRRPDEERDGQRERAVDDDGVPAAGPAADQAPAADEGPDRQARREDRDRGQEDLEGAR